MFDLLDSLRKKPAYVRKQVAVVISSAVSFVVFSMWIGSWGAQHESVSPETANAKPPGEVLLTSVRGIKDEGIIKWQDTMKQITDVVPKEGVAGVGAILMSDEKINDAGTGETPNTATESAAPNEEMPITE